MDSLHEEVAIDLSHQIGSTEHVIISHQYTMSTSKSKPLSTASSPKSNDQQALFYMALLALQFGVQPLLTRRFTPPGITRSTVVLVQECLKLGMAGFMLYRSGQMSTAFRDWTLAQWLNVALLPAALYAIQNMAALQAYQNLDALTFNVLNQTKTLSAALCCYIIMGKRQSGMQVIALCILMASALVMEKLVRIDQISTFVMSALGVSIKSKEDAEESAPITSEWNTQHFTNGVAPIMLASFLSGLAGALSQQNLQKCKTNTTGRNPYLFSMELCVASILILSASLTVSPDGNAILEKGFFTGWTWQTLIPILTNAAGGIVVGLVTKYAGSVRKGFALIFGIFLSGLIQSSQGSGVTTEQLVGGVLAAISLYMHAKNPPRATKTLKQD